MDINKIILLAAVTLFIYFFFIEIFTMLFRITGMWIGYTKLDRIRIDMLN